MRPYNQKLILLPIPRSPRTDSVSRDRDTVQVIAKIGYRFAKLIWSND